MLGVLGAVSAATFLVSVLGVPWLLTRLPDDFLVRAGSDAPGRTSPVRVALRVGRNLLGLLLIATGVALLVLPGQGLLTIVVGGMICDFPGKRRLERKVLGRPPVLAAVNAVRRRAGRPPLRSPPSAPSGA